MEVNESGPTVVAQADGKQRQEGGEEGQEEEEEEEEESRSNGEVEAERWALVPEARSPRHPMISVIDYIVWVE